MRRQPQPRLRRLNQVDGPTRAAQHLGGQPQGAGQHTLQMRVLDGRGGDAVERLQFARALPDPRVQPLGVGLHFVEQAGVVDGDGGLVGEGQSQLHLLGRETARLVAIDGQRADAGALDQQGQAQPGADVIEAGQPPPVLGRGRVVDEIGLAGVEHALQVSGGVVAQSVELLRADVHLAPRGEHHPPAIEQDDAGAGERNKPLELVQDAPQHFVTVQPQRQAGPDLAEAALALAGLLLRFQQPPVLYGHGHQVAHLAGDGHFLSLEGALLVRGDPCQAEQRFPSPQRHGQHGLAAHLGNAPQAGRVFEQQLDVIEDIDVAPRHSVKRLGYGDGQARAGRQLVAAAAQNRHLTVQRVIEADAGGHAVDRLFDVADGDLDDGRQRIGRQHGQADALQVLQARGVAAQRLLGMQPFGDLFGQGVGGMGQAGAFGLGFRLGLAGYNGGW